MRRKADTVPTHYAGRGRSLISTRTNQQQRKMQNSSTGRGQDSGLPRSYSSPSSRPGYEQESNNQPKQDKSCVLRSFSTPESKHCLYQDMDHGRNSDTFYRPKLHGSRTELDLDLENFEQFEEAFLDMDADQEQISFGSYKHPEKEEPKRVVTSLLPGSGLQRVCMRPVTVTSHNPQSLSNRRSRKDLHKDSVEQPKGIFKFKM